MSIEINNKRVKKYRLGGNIAFNVAF